MDLIQVDDVGLQAAQAAFAGLDHAGLAHLGAQPGHAAGRACYLGGQHEFFARARSLGEPVAENGLGGAAGFGPGGHRIHFRRVKEVDAALQRAVQDLVGIGFVDLFTKGHGAEADGGDLQAAGAQ
ncbi:hypothetical protein D9M68_839780 [compost metagenome]